MLSLFLVLSYMFFLIYDSDNKKARDGIRTRDPRLGKAILHH